MAEERLDKHSKIHHELFDEDTAQVGSLGDLWKNTPEMPSFSLLPKEASAGQMAASLIS